MSSTQSSGILLKILALAIPVAAAVWSGSAYFQKPAESAEVETPFAPLRAIGAVHPRISPDGKDVVFSYQGSIWRMPVDGGVMRRLAAVPGFAFEPCWSPDGKRIAFLAGRGWGTGQVKLVDAQTGAALPVAEGVFGTGKLGFSADGTKLLGNLRTDKQLDTFRWLDLKTGEMKTILRQKPPRQPWALSSSGKWVAFITTMDQFPEQQGGNDGPQVDVWRVGVDGGEPYTGRLSRRARGGKANQSTGG